MTYYISPADLAKRWNCAAKTVRNMVQTGVLVAIRVSPNPRSRAPRIQINLDSVRAYEQSFLEGKGVLA
jgi:hypothetical protein